MSKTLFFIAFLRKRRREIEIYLGNRPVGYITLKTFRPDYHKLDIGEFHLLSLFARLDYHVGQHLYRYIIDAGIASCQFAYKLSLAAPDLQFYRIEIAENFSIINIVFLLDGSLHISVEYRPLYYIVADCAQSLVEIALSSHSHTNILSSNRDFVYNV